MPATSAMDRIADFGHRLLGGRVRPFAVMGERQLWCASRRPRRVLLGFAKVDITNELAEPAHCATAPDGEPSGDRSCCVKSPSRRSVQESCGVVRRLKDADIGAAEHPIPVPGHEPIHRVPDDSRVSQAGQASRQGHPSASSTRKIAAVCCHACCPSTSKRVSRPLIYRP